MAVRELLLTLQIRALKNRQKQCGMATVEYIITSAFVAITLVSISNGRLIQNLLDALINFYGNFSFAMSLATP